MTTERILVTKSGDKIIGVWRGKEIYHHRSMWATDKQLKAAGFKLKTTNALGQTWYNAVKVRK